MFHNNLKRDEIRIIESMEKHILKNYSIPNYNKVLLFLDHASLLLK